MAAKLWTRWGQLGKGKGATVLDKSSDCFGGEPCFRKKLRTEKRRARAFPVTAVSRLKKRHLKCGSGLVFSLKKPTAQKTKKKETFFSPLHFYSFFFCVYFLPLLS